MKILFVNCSLRGGKAGHLFLPVGLGYVTTYVKKHGYSFDLLDIDAGGYDDDYVEKYMNKAMKNIAGVSVRFSPEILRYELSIFSIEDINF